MVVNNNTLSLINSLKNLWNNFTVKRKSQLVLITLATFITAILDLISIGSIMPFISVIMDSEQLSIIHLLINISNFMDIHLEMRLFYQSHIFLYLLI